MADRGPPKESWRSLRDHVLSLETTETTKVHVDIVLILKELTEWCRIQENREILSRDILDDLQKLLQKISILITDNDESDEKANVNATTTEVAVECFRVLRNCCANCPKNQNEIQNLPDLILSTKAVLLKLLDRDQVNAKDLQQEEADISIATVAQRCGLQFLGNAASGHEANQQLVWTTLSPHFSSFLEGSDNKSVNYTCMIIFNCLRGRRQLQVITQSAEGLRIMVQVVRAFTNQDTEWGLFILEKVVALDGILEKIIGDLEEDEWLALLEVAHVNIQKVTNDLELLPSPYISIPNLQFLSSQFKMKATGILGLSSAGTMDSQEPRIVGKLLEVLCQALALTEHHPEFVVLQQDGDLLQKALHLLHCMHMLGQQEGEKNVFSNAQKVSDLGSVDPDHPMFGFKKDLIRMIGNMCYEHRHNQDKVRELGGINLILQHTNVDGKNPFIGQWAVFAIRNLCKNNMENQNVIADMKMEGLADNLETLREFGIRAEIQGDKIIVKPDEDRREEQR